MNSSKKMPWRNAFYAYKVAGGGIAMKDDKYVNAYDTILINFNSFYDSKHKFIRTITMRDEDGIIFDDSTIIYEVNMTKASDLSYNYANKREEQIAIISRIFMAESSLELDKESNELMSKKDTEKLVSRAKELSSDEEYIRLFDEEENYKELIRNTELSEAHEAGVKQGSKETAINNAKNAKALGLDNNSISKITGLSIEEIENLK